MEKRCYLETASDTTISENTLQVQVHYIAFRICLNINTEENLVQAFVFFKDFIQSLPECNESVFLGSTNSDNILADG